MAEASEQKTAIASRLGFPATWNQDVGQKVIVEMELIADIAGLDPLLKDRFFLPFRELMQRQAEAYREKVAESTRISTATSRGRYEVRFVDKKDIYAFMRIGDFRPCCIATDGSFFGSTLPGFHADKMTQVFAIIDPDTKKGVGHMVGHLGLSGVGEDPTYFLNGLYLRTQHRGEAQDRASLDILEMFAIDAGIKVLRHGINP